jgi:FAD/FMN-containing dehydrogenase
MSHADKIARIVAQLRAHRGVRPLSLRKQSVSHQVPKANDARRGDDKIDVGALTEILSIDPVKRICVAESGVTFFDLVRATMRYGLAPVVVPELATITIGGAVSGCSIESMSFARGGFHDSCLEYEVITATGEVLACKPDDLVFEMMHGSFGTLGILSKLMFELVPAKPYVKLEYETYKTLADYQAAIQRRFDARDVDFMDGIIHSSTQYVLSLGTFVDTAPYTNRYDWMKVYYKSTLTRSEDYLETIQYYFRYNRGVTNVFPKSWLARLLFGRVVTSTTLLWFARKLPWLVKDDTVTLDVFVPFSNVTEFMSWYQNEIDFFPLWCVPYRRVRDYPWLTDGWWSQVDDPLFLDLAIYGLPGNATVHRRIEQALHRVNGMKTLIAHNYYPLNEFWSIYNRPNYEAVKQVTDPHDQFRDLYEKTCRATMGK